MPRYFYRAIPEIGRGEITGELEADSPEEAVSLLTSQKLVVLSLTEAKPSARRRLRVRLASLGQFYRTLGTLLQAGVNINVALASLAKSPTAGQVAAAIASYLAQGYALSQAAEAAGLPKGHVAAIKGAETGGNLPKTFLRLADNIEEALAMRGEVRGALTYPVAILGFIALLVYGLLKSLVPRFTSVLEGMGFQRDDYPIYSRIVIALSDFLRAYDLLLFLGIAALVASAVLWSRTPQGGEVLDRLFYRLPIIGPIRKNIALANFLDTLSFLLDAAVDLITAITIAGENTGSQTWVRLSRRIRELVESGYPLSQTMKVGVEEGYIPPEIPPLIEAGEESNAVPELAKKYADFLRSESRRAVAQSAKLIEPFMVVVMAVVVGGIILSLFVPFYDAINKLREMTQ